MLLRIDGFAAPASYPNLFLDEAAGEAATLAASQHCDSKAPDSQPLGTSGETAPNMEPETSSKDSDGRREGATMLAGFDALRFKNNFMKVHHLTVLQNASLLLWCIFSFYLNFTDG